MELPLKILFSSAGRRVALINIFKHEAANLAIPLEIHAVDMNPGWSPACQIADIVHEAPRCTDGNFIPRVREICETYGISAIIPTIDTELLPYANHIDSFRTVGTEILVSPATTLAIFRDKYQTVKLLSEIGVLTPKTVYCDGKYDGGLRFPIIAKPVDGSCSKGIQIINHEQDFSKLDMNKYRYISQEMIAGEEYTVNVFSRPDLNFFSATSHYRHFVRDGEVCFAETRYHHEIEKTAEAIVQGVPNLKGPFCFQGILNERGFFVFELNPRFGGGYPLAHQAGNRMARWILQELSSLTPDYSSKWQNSLRMLRFDEAVFMGGR